MTSDFRCPGCGGPLTVESRLSRVVVCPYCSQACEIEPSGIRPGGSNFTLAPIPSAFTLGCTGTILGERFKALGELRFHFDGGYWSEWLLLLNSGRQFWVQEDEGEITGFERVPLTSPLQPFDAVAVGSFLEVNGETLFVTEKTEAILAGARGELSFKVFPGQAVNCVDGNMRGRVYSIEYSPDEIAVSAGTLLSRKDLQVDR